MPLTRTRANLKNFQNQKILSAYPGDLNSPGKLRDIRYVIEEHTGDSLRVRVIPTKLSGGDAVLSRWREENTLKLLFQGTGTARFSGVRWEPPETSKS